MKPQSIQCHVQSCQPLTDTVFQLTCTPDPHFSFVGGQFVSIIIPNAGPQGKNLRRAYSIASPPDQKTIQFCIKKVENGPGTSYLSQLKPKDSFQMLAPYGNFVYQFLPNRHFCFIATGTGIAPFRSILFSKNFQDQPPLSTTCWFGVRSEDELLYTEEFQTVPQLNLVQAVSQPTANWQGFKGRITDFAYDGVDDQFPWQETEFYLCGNGSMIKEVKTFLIEQKAVQKASIHQEIYYR